MSAPATIGLNTYSHSPVACERRRRKARLMEIDPTYTDCIVRRYQEYTGKLAVLDGDGRSFDEVAQERRKERIAEQRLRGGSRFNLRYDGGVPRGITPREVAAALEAYVSFPPTVSSGSPGTDDRRFDV